MKMYDEIHRCNIREPLLKDYWVPLNYHLVSFCGTNTIFHRVDQLNHLIEEG